ncbi:MAG: hypothetical protein KDC53_00315 [Saprospiraceae bacterium]|nr:hypothetical protein [Saprospiraceae bacterium]
MKWINIFWIVISLHITDQSYGQDLHQTYQFAFEQMNAGNLHVAEKAFKRVLFFDEGNEYRTPCLLSLAQISSVNDDQFAALRYLDQAYFQTGNESLQTDIQFDRIQILIQQNNFQKALAEIYQLDVDIEPERTLLYEGYCQYKLKDFSAAESAFHQLCTKREDEETLAELIENAHKIEKINPKTYQLLSYFIPGLGQIRLGDSKNSINSVLLNGALVILFIDTARKLSFFDASISVVPWLFRYYSGGAKVAKDLAITKKQEKHDRNLNQMILLVAGS